MFRNFLSVMILCLLNIPLSHCRSYISPISFSRYDFQLLSRFLEYFYPPVDFVFYSYFLFFHIFVSESLSANLQNILQPIGTNKTPIKNNPEPMMIFGQYSHKVTKTPYIPMNPIKPKNAIRAIPNSTPIKNKNILIYLISFCILFTKITIKKLLFIVRTKFSPHFQITKFRVIVPNSIYLPNCVW